MSVAIDLSGQIALVTGASQGIGHAIACMLHRAGATVYLNHPDLGDGQTRRDAQGLADEMNAQRADSARVVAADVSRADDVMRMMETVKEQDGHLDLLVNNAGILRDRSIAKMTLDDWDAVIATNLSGVFLTSKFALEIMREGGAIVNLGSLSAQAGFHGQANYAAAKGGVHSLTRVLSREAARRKIRVNAVAPGIIATRMMDAVAENVRESMAQAIPMKRFGEPEEVASCVLFLLSTLASYVTGHILEIDGGWNG